MIDQETRLDNVIALPDNVLQYNYTMVNKEKEAIDINGLQKYIEPVVLNNMKTNPDMKAYRENRTTMTYSYKDKNGVFLFKISITPEMYSE